MAVTIGLAAILTNMKDVTPHGREIMTVEGEIAVTIMTAVVVIVRETEKTHTIKIITTMIGAEAAHAAPRGAVKRAIDPALEVEEAAAEAAVAPLMITFTSEMRTMNAKAVITIMINASVSIKACLVKGINN